MEEYHYKKKEFPNVNMDQAQKDHLDGLLKQMKRESLKNGNYSSDQIVEEVDEEASFMDKMYYVFNKTYKKVWTFWVKLRMIVDTIRNSFTSLKREISNIIEQDYTFYYRLYDIVNNPERNRKLIYHGKQDKDLKPQFGLGGSNSNEININIDDVITKIKSGKYETEEYDLNKARKEFAEAVEEDLKKEMTTNSDKGGE